MRIAYVTPEFVTENRGGGLATYLNNISKILAQNGHFVTIITSSAHNDDAIDLNGVIVQRVMDKGRWLPVPFFLLFRSYRLYRRLLKCSKKKEFDLIQYASYGAVGFFKVKKIPSVVRISSEPVTLRIFKIIDYKISDLEHACLSDKIEYRAIKSADQIFSPSRKTADYVTKWTGRDIDIIESPSFLDKSGYDYSIYEDTLKNKKYFLSHTSMSCLKGTHVIAECISDVCAKYNDVLFVFAGTDQGLFYRDGRTVSAKQYILEKAGKYKNNIVFFDALDRDKLYPIVDNSLGCIMPSRIDNMPNSCIEAMSMGKIVIGTRGSGFEQLIDDGVNGFLIDIDDSEGLKRTIIDICELDEETKAQIGNEARKTTERFNPENTYRIVEDYYGNIIKNSVK